MYITEVIIDGFKSYANRTIISGWDPKFNAITGLNGSGKSNILDAICFVLGISNLSQVRASSLRELVYKQGQARVTKASVSIVFCNDDPETSPVGYEQNKTITVTRQVVIGGRNKYLINGHTAQLNRVQNLFHSVQLNVNNPHFLIMQGRITKVLNMKPPEILAMIEEAAGTRMFEMKRASAVRTIEKKQTKVDEINKILVEDITPQLEKLRGEYRDFVEWSAGNGEIERLERFVVAYLYYKANEVLEKNETELGEITAELESKQRESEMFAERIEGISSEIDAISTKRTKEMSGKYTEIEAKVTELSKTLVKETSLLEHSEERIKTEENALAQIHSNIEKCNIEKEKKIASRTEFLENFTKIESENNKLIERRNRLESQQLGIDMKSGNDDSVEKKGSIVQQLMAAEKAVLQGEAELTGLDMKLQHAQADIKEKNAQKESARKEFQGIEKELQTFVRESETFRQKIEETDFSEDEMRARSTEIRALEEKITETKHVIESMQSSMESFEFRPNVSKGTVFGKVGSLIHVKDAKNMTALEITAGNRLFNVIVDAQSTGKEILTRYGANLKSRITIIPLNKIAQRSITPDVISRAERLVGVENVSTAVSLIGFNPEIEAAMNFIFGGSFVCSSPGAAKSVTFDRGIHTKSVTLDGDVYDPSGVLTGGSRSRNSSILKRLHMFHQAKEDYENMCKLLHVAKEKFNVMKRVQQSVESYRTKIEILQHKMDILEEKKRSCQFEEINREINQITAAVEAIRVEYKEVQSRIKENSLIAKELKNSIKDSENSKEGNKKEIEKELKLLKKSQEKCGKKLAKLKTQMEGFDVEIAVSVNEMTALEESQKELEEKISTLKAKHSEIERSVQEITHKYTHLESVFEKEKSKLVKSDSELKKLSKQKSEITKLKNETNLELKRLTNKVNRFNKETEAEKSKVERLCSEYAWINAEKHLFNQENSEYDFRGVSYEKVAKKLEAKKEKHEKLGKKLNKKAMGMKDKAEEEYEQLIRKREIVKKDKAKIEQVIRELDDKKNEALVNTYEKVCALARSTQLICR